MKRIVQQRLGLSLKKPIRFTLTISLLVFPMSCWAGAGASSRDAMEEGSRKLAGPKAIDCGRVGIHQDPKLATDCALSAFKAGKPFRVRYDLQGIDSSVAAGLIRTPDGKLYGMVFDSVGMTKSGSPNEKLRYFITTACPKPVHVWVTESGRLNCFPPSKSKGNLMSPTFSPY
jgi:hypothetical protein